MVPNKVEAACARSDLFERRRLLMDDWAAYLDGQRGQVVSVRSVGTAGHEGSESAAANAAQHMEP